MVLIYILSMGESSRDKERLSESKFGKIVSYELAESS